MEATATMAAHRARLDRIRSIDASRVVPERMRHRHTIKDVLKGGVIRLEGATYVVAGISTYVETNESFSKERDSKWYELRLIDLATGEVVWVEWEEDDELVISRTARSLSFRDLSDDGGVNIDEDDLDQIVDDKDSVYLGGREYEYEDDYAARYLRNGEGRDVKGDKVYFYDFISGAGEMLTIEEWKDGKDDYSYELFLSRQIAANSITIIALGTEG